MNLYLNSSAIDVKTEQLTKSVKLSQKPPRPFSALPPPAQLLNPNQTVSLLHN